MKVSELVMDSSTALCIITKAKVVWAKVVWAKAWGRLQLPPWQIIKYHSWMLLLVQILHEAPFLVISKSSHNNFMLCTGTALCFHTPYNTCFSLIPAMTCPAFIVVTILVSLFTGLNFSLAPRPSQKAEDGLVFRAIFLVTWAGPYFQRNDMIAYFNPELESLMPWWIWTTTWPHLQKLDMGAKSIGPAENRLRDTFNYLHSGSK